MARYLLRFGMKDCGFTIHAIVHFFHRTMITKLCMTIGRYWKHPPHPTPNPRPPCPIYFLLSPCYILSYNDNYQSKQFLLRGLFDFKASCFPEVISWLRYIAIIYGRTYLGFRNKDRWVCFAEAIWHCPNRPIQWQHSFQMKAALLFA